MSDKEQELEQYTIRHIMGTENGRSFMWRCLINCCTFSSTYSSDPMELARLAGKREQGLWLERELREAAPDEYLKMRREHINE